MCTLIIYKNSCIKVKYKTHNDPIQVDLMCMKYVCEYHHRLLHSIHISIITINGRITATEIYYCMW